MGRWSSAAFVKYIRPQVMEWTAGMSLSMIRSPDFRHADPAAARPADFKALQSNLDAAMENPKELQFSGSLLESAGSNPLNLGF
ncbi:hypothetical protein ACA910_014145 [Epithemia clementina (nom. ined.)]